MTHQALAAPHTWAGKDASSSQESSAQSSARKVTTLGVALRYLALGRAAPPKLRAPASPPALRIVP